MPHRSNAADRGPPRGVRLERRRGWKMPADTKSVARPGPMGNPVRIGATWEGRYVADAAAAVAAFEAGCAAGDARFPGAAAIASLRGWNLACWCELGTPCHRDVLLRLANPPPTSPEILSSEMHKNSSGSDR